MVILDHNLVTLFSVQCHILLQVDESQTDISGLYTSAGGHNVSRKRT